MYLFTPNQQLHEKSCVITGGLEIVDIKFQEMTASTPQRPREVEVFLMGDVPQASAYWEGKTFSLNSRSKSMVVF